MCDQQWLRSACAYAQSDQSLCWTLEYYMSVKLLTEHHLEFLNLKGGYTGSSESTLVKMSHCWKSHAAAHISYYSLTCHKRPLKKKTKTWFLQDRLLLNAGQTYCRMLQESILQYFRPSLCNDLPLRPLFCLFFEWPLKTGFTVLTWV